MQRKEFLEKTVIQLDDDLFGEFKKLIVGKYISFSFIKKESITKETLAEKLFDYFDKKKGKETFDSLLKKYISDLDSMVIRLLIHLKQTKKTQPQQFRAHGNIMLL